MYPALFERPSRNIQPLEDVPNVIDELDEEDGYDRFSAKTFHEFQDPYKELEGEEDEDLGWANLGYGVEDYSVQ